MIEEPPPELAEDAEEVIDLFINLVLAFNLHFDLPSENAIMRMLEEQGTAKNLTEKLLLLFNRGGKEKSFEVICQVCHFLN